MKAGGRIIIAQAVFWKRLRIVHLFTEWDTMGRLSATSPSGARSGNLLIPRAASRSPASFLSRAACRGHPDIPRRGAEIKIDGHLYDDNEWPDPVCIMAIWFDSRLSWHGNGWGMLQKGDSSLPGSVSVPFTRGRTGTDCHQTESNSRKRECINPWL